MIINICKTFFFKRLIIMGFTYLIILYLAGNVEAAVYGDIALIIFFLKSFSSMNLGLSYGYWYFVYKDDSELYLKNYVIGYLVVGFFAILIGAVIVSPMLLFLGPFILLISVLDPLLRTEKVFTLSLFPELILIFSFFIVFILWGKFTGIAVFGLVCSTSLLTVGVLYLYKDKINKLISVQDINLQGVKIQNIVTLINNGFSSYVYMLAIFCFLFIDRVLMKHFYSADILGTCLIASQLIQASFFLMSSWNFTSLVDTGELIRSRQFCLFIFYKRLLITACLGLLPLIIIFIIINNHIISYFESYINLVSVFQIIATGLFFSNLATCVMPILFFYKKQYLAAVGMLFCVLSMTTSYLVSPIFSISYFKVLELNYLCLSIVSIGIIVFSVNILNQEVLQSEENI